MRDPLLGDEAGESRVVRGLRDQPPDHRWPASFRLRARHASQHSDALIAVSNAFHTATAAAPLPCLLPGPAHRRAPVARTEGMFMTTSVPWGSSPPQAPVERSRASPTACRRLTTAPTASLTSTAAPPSATTGCGASTGAAKAPAQASVAGRRRTRSSCASPDLCVLDQRPCPDVEIRQRPGSWP